MSFIADDGFSFLDTYRDRSNGGDEGENERSHVSSKKDFDFSFIGYREIGSMMRVTVAILI